MTDTTDIKALRESAESIMNLLENLAGFDPQDIDMDAVELRFEDENGFDTGCDISIVDTAQQSAGIIRALLDQLEAERQRDDNAHKYGSERDAENESLMLTVGRLRVEIAALKGTLEPVALVDERQGSRGFCLTQHGKRLNLQHGTELFTAPQKPVVLPPLPAALGDFTEAAMKAVRRMDIAAIEAAGGIVKDGD